MRKSNRLATLFLFALTAALAAGCSERKQDADDSQAKVEGDSVTFLAGDKAPYFKTEKVSAAPFPSTKLNGRLVWNEDRTVRVFAPLGGRVTRIFAEPGKAVAVGERLAIVSSPDLGQAQAEAQRAESDLRVAAANLERVRELESHGVAPRKDLQSAEAEHDRAKAELSRAGARLKLYGGGGGAVDQSFAITSPIAGVVVEKNINPGQEVRPDQMTSNAPPLFVVTDPRHLWVRLDASEKDLANLKVGQKVGIRSPAQPDAVMEARIESISDFVDPETRAVRVRAAIDNPERRLKAEMFVTGEIASPQPPRIQVPERAVMFQGGKRFVFTAEGGAKYTRREVQVGDVQQGRIVILDGLQEGQEVVTDGVLMLQQTVQPRRVQK